MLVAVTGATGFVGPHVVRALLQCGHHVRALTRRPAPPSLASLSHVDTVTGDLGDGAALAALVHGAQAVVHLVGIIAERGTATFRAIHVEGTRAVVDAARRSGVRRLVHMSAIGPRPDPDATPYHRTKWAAEEIVRGSGLSAAILRPTVINGPESVPIRTLARVHRWSPFVPVFGDARFPLEPIWVDDVAAAFVRAVEQHGISGTFELGGPAVLTFEDFVRAIGRASGHERPLVHVPLGLVRVLARLADPLGPLAPITSGQLQMLVEGSFTKPNAIETVFGIRPLEFEEGLRRYLR